VPQQEEPDGGRQDRTNPGAEQSANPRRRESFPEPHATPQREERGHHERANQKADTGAEANHKGEGAEEASCLGVSHTTSIASRVVRRVADARLGLASHLQALPRPPRRPPGLLARPGR
jgi:hypothetical protein